MGILERGREFVTDSMRSHHHTVNHGPGQYVKDFYNHASGIESVWALFKRQSIGACHRLSPKQLSRYLGDMAWRFNFRSIGEEDRVNALLDRISGRLTYKEPIA